MSGAYGRIMRPILMKTALVLAAAAMALVAVFEPAATWWFPSCPLHALTGWLCPLCGSLRAVHAILHGSPVAALTLIRLRRARASSIRAIQVSRS